MHVEKWKRWKQILQAWIAIAQWSCMIEIFAQNHEVDFIENDTLDCGLAFSFLGYRRMAGLIVQFQA